MLVLLFQDLILITKELSTDKIKSWLLNDKLIKEINLNMLLITVQQVH